MLFTLKLCAEWVLNYFLYNLMSFKNSDLNQGIMPCTQLSSNFLMSFLAESFQLTSPQPCGCPLIFFFLIVNVNFLHGRLPALTSKVQRAGCFLENRIPPCYWSLRWTQIRLGLYLSTWARVQVSFYRQRNTKFSRKNGLNELFILARWLWQQQAREETS